MQNNLSTDDAMRNDLIINNAIQNNLSTDDAMRNDLISGDAMRAESPIFYIAQGIALGVCGMWLQRHVRAKVL